MAEHTDRRGRQTNDNKRLNPTVSYFIISSKRSWDLLRNNHNIDLSMVVVGGWERRRGEGERLGKGLCTLDYVGVASQDTFSTQKQFFWEPVWHL